MDLPLSFSFSTLVILVVIILSKLIKAIRDFCNPTQPRIPGPWKLPLIGSLHHLGDSSSPPHQILRHLARRHGPIMHLNFGERSTVVISSARLAKEVLKTHDQVFPNRQITLAAKIIYDNGKDVAFSPHGEYWRQMRKICMVELLSNTKVKSFASIREDEAKKLVRAIQSSPGSPIDLTKHLSSYSNAVVCRAAFGNTYKAQEVMIPLFGEMLQFLGKYDVSDLFPSLWFLHGLSTMKPRLKKLHGKLDMILDSIIAERREILANRKRDLSVDDSKHEEKYLLDALLRLEGSGGLKFAITTSNIKPIIADMFVGGTHTTSSVTDWSMTELLRNRRVMEKAQAELRQVLKGKPNVEETDAENLSYLKSVVKESLRLHMPGPLLPRISNSECEIGGYVLPINTGVVINAWALGRDPEYWENPESFEPERFENSSIDISGSHNFEYLPFGAGRRSCAGTSFGFTTILFPLAQLLYHFDWRLPDGMKPDELDMTEGIGFGNARKESLFVVATPHFQSNLSRTVGA